MAIRRSVNKERSVHTYTHIRWDGQKAREPEVAQVERIEINSRKKGGKQNTRLFCQKGKERSLFWSRNNEFFMHSEANVNGETCNGQLGPAEAA